MPTIVDLRNLALAQVGLPYVFGGIGLRGSAHPGLDCSGLEYAICLALGQDIPRSSETQFAGLPPVAENELRQGDEVFYDVASDNQPQPAHCALWWSPTEVLQAPRTGLNVGLYPNSQLPYPIMGYRRLPFPDAPAPGPIPPLPVPIKEETMSLELKPDGSIIISAVGAGSRNDHLMVFTLKNPFDPASPGYNVIDVTDGIGGGDPYTVQSA